MSITAERKKELINEFAVSNNDTGSVEVQVSVLTERIHNLTAHVKDRKKDFSSTRGLIKLVGKRRRLLNYLKDTAVDRYNSLIAKLGLKR